jgi:hypothetical protein
MNPRPSSPKPQKRKRPRHVVHARIDKRSATKMAALMERALDEGRSFKVEVAGDRMVIELGPKP